MGIKLFRSNVLLYFFMDFYSVKLLPLNPKE
nr:MAG TPA: hypothetical protein [Caudoviricetes sp.]